MRGASSAPTERVLDVLELLGRPAVHGMRFSDVVRELDLSQSTAHSILKTLSDRGWLRRDPVTKQFALGPAVTLMATHLDTARPSTRRRAMPFDGSQTSPACRPRCWSAAATNSSSRLSSTPRAHLSTTLPNERIPYAPPFGIAFAAWDTADEQEAWITRGAAATRICASACALVLTRTRERGYDIDWMTPALSQAAHAIGTLSGDGIPHNLRSVIDQLRVEFASANSMPDDRTRGAHPIATIAAPVLDADDRIALILAIHPLRAMAMSEIRSAAEPLLREIAQVGHRIEPEGTGRSPRFADS